jgi:hypothetical protein
MSERQARFEALYAANHALIFGYALRRTASPDDAADILADTFHARPSSACDPSRMPGGWYVHDLAVYGGNQAIAIIGPDRPAPAAG